MKAHLRDANSVYLRAARNEVIVTILYILAGLMILWAPWALGDKGFWSLVATLTLHTLVSYLLAEGNPWRRAFWALLILIIEILAITALTFVIATLNVVTFTNHNPFPFSREKGLGIDWKMLWETAIPVGGIVMGIFAQLLFIRKEAHLTIDESPRM